MANEWYTRALLEETPADADTILLSDISDTTEDTEGTVKRNTYLNFLGTVLAGLRAKTVPSGELVGTSDTQTLSSKTLASPVVTGSLTVPDGALAIADTSGLQSALDAKAPLASPTFTGTVTVPNDSISYAEIQNVSATDMLLGRSTAGAGDIEEIPCTAFGRSLIDDAADSNARTTLGLVIGTHVQAWDAQLDTWATVTPSANGQSLVAAANYAAMRGLLDLEAGTDFYSIAAADAAFQPIDADLTALAAAGNSAVLAATTASFLTADETKLDGVEALADVTDAANVAAAGAHMSGGTDVPVADGGTGASTASGARTNLGLVIGTDVLAFAGTGLVDHISGHIETVANKTYVLDLKAPYAYTINSLAAKTASGTCTVKLTIDGVDVTGITALAVSSTEDFDDATAANAVSVGTTVALVASSNAAALDLQFSVKITR